MKNWMHRDQKKKDLLIKCYTKKDMNKVRRNNPHPTQN